MLIHRSARHVFNRKIVTVITWGMWNAEDDHVLCAREGYRWEPAYMSPRRAAPGADAEESHTRRIWSRQEVQKPLELKYSLEEAETRTISHYCRISSDTNCGLYKYIFQGYLRFLFELDDYQKFRRRWLRSMKRRIFFNLLGIVLLITRNFVVGNFDVRNFVVGNFVVGDYVL